jgi:hypothetical protein
MLGDLGSPRLKQVALGLLMKLRFEKNIMNETKDGPADYLAAMTGPDDEDSDEQF